MLRISLNHATSTKDDKMKITAMDINGIVVICILLLNHSTIGYAADINNIIINNDGKFSDTSTYFFFNFLFLCFLLVMYIEWDKDEIKIQYMLHGYLNLIFFFNHVPFYINVYSPKHRFFIKIIKTIKIGFFEKRKKKISSSLKKKSFVLPFRKMIIHNKNSNYCYVHR